MGIITAFASQISSLNDTEIGNIFILGRLYYAIVMMTMLHYIIYRV